MHIPIKLSGKGEIFERGRDDKESNDSYFNYAYISVQIHSVLISECS